MTPSPSSVYMGAPVEIGTGPKGEIANRAYSAFGKQFDQKVYPVTPGLWCHVGLALGNSTMIEGKTGLIIIDSADCIQQAERQQAQFRKISDKPVKALIYSHCHYAFGSRAWIAPEQEGQIPVWAHPELMQIVLRTVGDLTPFTARRAAIQFGLYLPSEGADSMSHQGMGSVLFELDKYQPRTGFVRPTHHTADGMEVEIDGVRMQFFHAVADTEDTIMVWLPESRTVVNNIAWPSLYNICTLRGETFRNPLEALKGLDKIIALQPDHLVGVHGVPISGREEILRVVTEYRDAIQYIYDQTVRGIIAGLSPDELAQQVKLPTKLAASRNNGEFYGELSYHVRQIYSGLVGWFGRDTVELHPATHKEQATRLLALVGGAGRMAEATREALAKKEYAWAAQLATWLIESGADTPEHRQLKADALRAMGQVTTAANTRAWYLTQALELEGKVDTRAAPFRMLNAGMVLQMPPSTYVNGLRFLLAPELSAQRERTIHLRLATPDNDFTLQLRHGIVQILPGVQGRADSLLRMSFDAWARLVGKEVKARALIDSGEIVLEGERDLAMAVLAIGGPIGD